MVVNRLANARSVAFEVLERVQKDDSYVNLLLPSVLSKSNLPEVDRGLVQEIAYGSLRWQLQYDAFADILANQKPIDPKVRIALRMGLHQLLRMRIPSHAAINETVELVKTFSPKASGFANAILRAADRSGLDQLLAKSLQGKTESQKTSITFSHPEWVIGALIDALELDGRDAIEAVLSANNETPDINLVSLSTEASERLLAQGIEKSEVSPIGFVCKGNPEPLLSKDVRVQDLGSQLVALTLLELANRDGAFLDMCSGPGGKSAVLLSGISKQGSLLCLEPTPHRAKLVEQALGGDSRAKVEIRKGQTAEKESFDAVLLDAPCSGLGSLRRKPESRWRKKPSQVPELNRTQSELLAAGLQSLRSGGVLVYSTCSPVISETNTQVAEALGLHAECELIDVKPILRKLSPGIELNESRKTVQLWTDIHRTDCMFIAAFRKR